MNNNITLFAFISLFMLTACGGGSSSTPSTSTGKSSVLTASSAKSFSSKSKSSVKSSSKSSIAAVSSIATSQIGEGTPSSSSAASAISSESAESSADSSEISVPTSSDAASSSSEIASSSSEVASSSSEIASSAESSSSVMSSSAESSSSLVASSASSSSNNSSVIPGNWVFRGTPNNWAKTPMTVSNGLFVTCQKFAEAGSAFKISNDDKADWIEAYPSANYTVEQNFSYDITFNSTTHEIKVTKRASACGSVASSSVSSSSVSTESWVFRGTPNAWGKTPLTQANNLFVICQKFAETGSAFKISNGNKADWLEAYPSQNYTVDKDFSYDITFNPTTHAVIATKRASACGEVISSSSSVAVSSSSRSVVSSSSVAASSVKSSSSSLMASSSVKSSSLSSVAVVSSSKSSSSIVASSVKSSSSSVVVASSSKSSSSIASSSVKSSSSSIKSSSSSSIASSSVKSSSSSIKSSSSSSIASSSVKSSSSSVKSSSSSVASSSVAQAASHHPGERCISCHVANGAGAAGGVFTFAGTVFKSDGTPQNKATVKLMDSNFLNVVISLETDGNGNFYTKQALGASISTLRPVISAGGRDIAMGMQPMSDCNFCHASGGLAGGHLTLD